ncbi:MAG: replicative DNA helicase [Immundisolibacteraceae bacterium]|nr:replicative DNA helicase [Immundisolibacteraceae bacterium]
MEVEQLKIPPHSIDAEQSVLGGLMLDSEAWELVADRVGEDDFYRQSHQIIFAAIRKLHDRSEPCDVITLSEALQAIGKVDEVGGLAYLGELAQGTPSSANIAAYADIIRERSITRQLTRVGSRIAESGFNPDGRTVAELLDSAEKEIFDIAERGAKGKKGFVSIEQVLPDVISQLDELFNSDGSLSGLSTGFADLDEKTAGLQKSDLIIIAARPSMGKTSLVMNLAENVAIRERVPVAIFSMEMPANQLANRLLASLGRVDTKRLRTGDLAEDDWPRITSAVTLLSEAPIYIDDTPALSPMELRARARRLKRKHGLGLILVDYLQLMQVPGSNENRTNEISEISRTLKALAKELEVPVVALSQLNRSLEQRPDKRPKMSDLRESGAIEQDADVILFIYRDEVYNDDSDAKGIAEIIIAKQRNGPIGTLRLAFVGAYTRFEDLAFSDYGAGEFVPE